MNTSHLRPLTERPLISTDVLDVDDRDEPTETFVAYVAEWDDDPSWIHIRYEHDPSGTWEVQWRLLFHPTEA